MGTSGQLHNKNISVEDIQSITTKMDIEPLPYLDKPCEYTKAIYCVKGLHG